MTVAPAVAAHRRPDPLHRLGQIGFGLRRILTTLAGHGIGRTVVLGDRGTHRGVAFDADLAMLKAGMRPLGATVNDALLASVAAGYVAALSAVGEHLPAELPVSIPVALRRRGASNNQVGVMLVRLPLAVPEPDTRLRLIGARTRTDKERAREQGTLEFMRGPLGARIMDHIARRQHVVAGFITNVPGPSDQLRLAGGHRLSRSGWSQCSLATFGSVSRRCPTPAGLAAASTSTKRPCPVSCLHTR